MRTSARERSNRRKEPDVARNDLSMSMDVENLRRSTIPTTGPFYCKARTAASDLFPGNTKERTLMRSLRRTGKAFISPMRPDTAQDDQKLNDEVGS